MHLTTVLFYILALVTGVCAVAVVVSQNIVRAAAWLLFALAGTAGVFFLLGADFVGATQLLVYVGGTLVLVVFGVMLTAQGPFISMRIGAAEWVISLAVGLLLYGMLAVSFILWNPPPAVEVVSPPEEQQARLPGSTVLGESLLNLTGATGDVYRQRQAPPKTNRPQKGMGYLLPFEIVSVHLLVVLIGAAYLARTKRRRGAVAPANGEAPTGNGEPPAPAGLPRDIGAHA
jgi:NADH:ubiquinone oxidoreductase subunit 6 (subunit J)